MSLNYGTAISRLCDPCVTNCLCQILSVKTNLAYFMSVLSQDRYSHHTCNQLLRKFGYFLTDVRAIHSCCDFAQGICCTNKGTQNSKGSAVVMCKTRGGSKIESSMHIPKYGWNASNFISCWYEGNTTWQNQFIVQRTKCCIQICGLPSTLLLIKEFILSILLYWYELHILKVNSIYTKDHVKALFVLFYY